MICSVVSAKESTARDNIGRQLDSLSMYSLPDSQKAAIYYKLSCSYAAENIDSAVWSGNQAIYISKEKNYTSLFANASLQQGTNYIRAYKFDSAFTCFNSAIDAFTKINDHPGLYASFNMMSYLCQLTEIWDKAWEYSQRALEIFNQYGNTEYLPAADMYIRFAGIYNGLNDITQAEHYFNMAKQDFAETKNTDKLGNCCLQMAKMHMYQQRNLPLSRQELDSALHFFSIENNPLRAAEVYKALGDYYILLNNADEAEKNFITALSLYTAKGSPVDIQLIRTGLGKVALMRQQLNTARAFAAEAYDFFKQRDDKKQRLETILLLSEIDRRLGLKRKAYAYLDEYRNVSDSIKLMSGELRARDMMIKYTLTSQEKENNTLKKQNEKEDQNLALLIVSGFVILLTSIFLALLFIQKNNALKKLETMQLETEQKNHELEKLQKETEEKNKELAKINSIKDRLISMIAHDIRSPLASLQNTLTLTRENILNAEEFSGLSRNLESDIYNLRGMLDNMLLWSREQVVEINVNKASFNIDEVVNEIVAMQKNSLMLKNITVHNYLQHKLEVISDKEMVTAVLRNIFSNALKFTPAGKNIYIHQMMLNNKIYISVRDEGQGIPSEVLEKINNKEHISTRGTGNEKGTGIGLMFCRELLQKLDETFDITTLPGKGTSVTFSVGYK